MIKFKQITSCKYVGSDGYTLKKGRDGRFSIFKENTITKWGTGFQTVRAAEIFLDNHDYINASTENILLDESDIEFIGDMYGCNVLHHDKGITCHLSTRYSIVANKISPCGYTVSIQDNISLRSKKFNNPYDLFHELDKLGKGNIIYSGSLRGADLRYILAKNNARSPRDITKNLVRVKSSNVWSYGIEIKDNKSKVGDVYIQFKNKDGGRGDIYRYYDVPLSTWRKFIGAPSKGHFLWKYLRNNFLYSKLTGDKKGKLKNAINR